MDLNEEALRRQEMTRGENARRILDDEIFLDAVRELRDGALRAFKQASPGDVEALRVARLEYEVTERLITNLTNVLKTGKMAAEQLSVADKAREFLKRKRGYAA